MARSKPAPLYRDILRAAPEGHAFWVQTEDGKRIRAAVFPGGRRGSIILYPGRTEFIEKFDDVISRLVKMGFWVAVNDWRGQGLSDRPFGNTDLGHVLHYSEYQRDVAALMATPEYRTLPRPRVLFSHSMGGALALRSLINGLDVKAAVFSSPMWGFDINIWLRVPTYFATQAARLFRFGHLHAPGGDRQFYPLKQGFDGNLLTNDPVEFERYRQKLQLHPELGLGGGSYRWLRESMDEMARLRHAELPKLPILAFMAENEGIVSKAATRQFMTSMPNGRLELVKGAQHEGWLEVPATREWIWAKTAQFLAEVGV